MLTEMAIALRVTLATLVVTGLLYPLAVTGAAQGLFPDRANGSRVGDQHGEIGSALVAQGFKRPGYFQPRPSAAGDDGYDASNSSGSNLGPTSKKLRDRVAADLVRLELENPDAPSPVPAELVTTSASGLDPHLSREGALWQVPRIAKARGVHPDRVRTVVEAAVEGRDLGILGEPRINVLRLNQSLDLYFGQLGPAMAVPSSTR
jgi:potassium-transporting ATPase KdpC subunit